MIRSLSLCAVVAATACSSGGLGSSSSSESGATGPSCRGSCEDGGAGGDGDGAGSSDGSSGAQDVGCGGIDGRKDCSETDIDCGGGRAPKCGEGKSCAVDDDCEVACSYAKRCVGAPSCKPHLGGDTCGPDEVEMTSGGQESCCRTLEVAGYTDAAHPGKKVYLDKYEITAGRVRAWIEAMAKEHDGEPDVKTWIAAHRPQIWDDAWNDFLPEGWSGPSKVIARRLLGDPRPEDFGWGVGPGVILPPPTDEPRNMGVDYQFNSEVYVDLHGSNCGTWDATWGFPTFHYPADVLARNSQLPRADGTASNGARIPAKELLDVKSMNCITNVMLAAFCAWDGGQLATDEVLDYVTATPATLGYVSGCGTQYDNHGDLLKNDFSRTVQSGGRCPDVPVVNATFDAGDNLPVKDSPLNEHRYHYPDLGNVTHDKAWEIAAPGRLPVDAIAISATSEPWMDLAGNLNEAALDMNGATFTGYFSLKFRGIAYGSARSDLNVGVIIGESIKRLQRPEAKAAYTGGRCMRFR